VANAGPDTATNVQLTDTFPAGITVLSGTPSAGTYANGVWDVGTRIDSLGWTAEFRIPLSQMRYSRDRTHTFGLTIDRDIYRYAERVSWPMLSPSTAGPVSQLGTPTGMAALEEVDEAVERIVRFTDKLILLQCTSTYPSEFADINLRVMDTFSTRYGVLVGYSGHERGIAVSEAAATLGACVLERHFTKDRTLPGPDHAASLEPFGLEKLVRDVRHIEAAMGSAEKCVAASEVPVRARLAKSVVAAQHIPAGTVVQAAMLTVKGPGDGIPANHVARLIGRVAAVDVLVHD